MKTIKITNIGIYVIFFLITLYVLFLIFVTFPLENEVFNNKIQKRFFLESEVKAGIVDNYFLLKKNEIATLSKMSFVKEIFDSEIVTSRKLAKEDALRESKIIKKDIENFLIAFANLTAEDLKYNNEFQKISTQEIDGVSYGFVYNLDEKEIISHPNKKFIGQSISSTKTTAEGWEKSLEMLKDDEESSEVFYKFTESNGEIKEKFELNEPLLIKTADNKRLLLATTTYIKNYKILNNISNDSIKFIKKIIEYSNFENINLLSKEGNVIYEANQTRYYGKKLSFIDESDKIFQEIKTVKVFGPFPNYAGAYNFLVISPVINNNETIGFVSGYMPAKKVNEIIEKTISKEKGWQGYIITDSLLLASSSDVDKILVQEIKTENSRRCLRDEIIDNFIEEKGYTGNESYGYCKKIDAKFSLIIELDKNYAQSIIDAEYTGKNMYIILTLFVFLLFGIFSNILINRRYKIRKIKPLCLLFKSKKINKLSFAKIAIFSALISATIFVIITTISGGWGNNLTYQVNLFNTILLGIGLYFAISSFRIKTKKSKIFIFLGGMVLFIIKFYEIFIQLFSSSCSSHIDELCFFITSFKYLSILLIFEGYRRYSTK